MHSKREAITFEIKSKINTSSKSKKFMNLKIWRKLTNILKNLDSRWEEILFKKDKSGKNPETVSISGNWNYPINFFK